MHNGIGELDVMVGLHSFNIGLLHLLMSSQISSEAPKLSKKTFLLSDNKYKGVLSSPAVACRLGCCFAAAGRGRRTKKLHALRRHRQRVHCDDPLQWAPTQVAHARVSYLPC